MIVLPPNGKPGQILVMRDGHWVWEDSSETRISGIERRFLMWVAIGSASLLLAAFFLCFVARYALAHVK